MTKIIAEARKELRAKIGKRVSNASYIVAVRNSPNFPWSFNYHSYICHGGLLGTRRQLVGAIVENLSVRYSQMSVTRKRQFKLYLDYVINRSPLAGVSHIKNVSSAIRYGVPFDVDNYDDFGIRAFAIMLRRAKEDTPSLPIFEKVLEMGYSEHTAAIAFHLLASDRTNKSVYYSGGHDHTLFISHQKIAEVGSFMSVPYVKTGEPFANIYHMSSPIHATISPSIIQDRRGNYRRISDIATEYLSGDTNHFGAFAVTYKYQSDNVKNFLNEIESHIKKEP